jgi:rhomboid protease GluP
MNRIKFNLKRYFKKFPVTATLLTLNTIMVFVVIFTGSFTTQNLIRWGGLLPSKIETEQEYYRLLTSMFLHGGIIHFLANSYFLHYLGGFTEKILGSKKYLFVYFVSGLGSSILVFLLSNSNTVTIGASGALFGILGSLLTLTFTRKHWFPPMVINNIRSITIINLVFTFLIVNISVYGHLGGLITGIVLIYFVTPEKPYYLNNLYDSSYTSYRNSDIIIDYKDIIDDDDNNQNNYLS